MIFLLIVIIFLLFAGLSTESKAGITSAVFGLIKLGLFCLSALLIWTVFEYNHKKERDRTERLEAQWTAKAEREKAAAQRHSEMARTAYIENNKNVTDQVTAEMNRVIETAKYNQFQEENAIVTPAPKL